MNELSVRLTADIAQLQSALAKAKKTISEFEKETTQETGKSNKLFQSQIGILEKLEFKAKLIRNTLKQATNEKDIERYNQELEQTIKEMSRLNALGRQVTNTLGGANNGFNQATRSIGSANGVALEFNRIIQDAPFGIIGIGNNLQQLAGNFSAVKAQAGSTGKAISASLAALVSPTNLALLAVSALTSAFTLYQLGAFDSAEETNFLKEAYDDLAESADNAAERIAAIRFAGDKINEEIDRVLGLDSSFSLLGASSEQLTEIINRAFARLDRTQLEALQDNIEEIANDQLRKLGNELGLTREQAVAFANSLKTNDQAFEELSPAIRDAVGAYLRFSNQAELLNNQLDFYEDKTKKSTKATKELTDSFDANIQKVELMKASYEDFKNIGNVFESALKNERTLLERAIANDKGERDLEPLKARLAQVKKILEQFQGEIKEIDVGLNLGGGEDSSGEIGLIQELKAEIESLTKARDVATDPARIQAYSQQIIALQEQLQGLTGGNQTLQDSNKAILDSFSALGIGIASSLDISNNALKGFITTVLSSTPKIIAAIIAQAQANKAAAAITNQANAQQAAGNVVVSATEAAKGLGPVGLAVLPVLIGGALALISSAFSKTGASVPSGGGGGSIGAPPQIFTNNPQSFSPNYTGFNGGSPLGQLELTATASYDSIIFGLGQYQEARNRS